MNLNDFFAKNNKIALAFSGGVDSAYLMYEAIRHGVDVKAYYVKSQFQPAFEFNDATKLAKELGCEMKIIDIDVLSCKEIKSNPSNRCYYCKKKIFESIKNAAKDDGYEIIVDGTNASDDFNDRPGMRVMDELKIISPLRLSGLTKDDVRLASKKAGLWTFDKPSYSCLATRVESGIELDKDILSKVEKSEGILNKLGFKDYRVRTDGRNARLELTADDMLLAVEKRKEIVASLKEYFEIISMGLEER